MWKWGEKEQHINIFKYSLGMYFFLIETWEGRKVVLSCNVLSDLTRWKLEKQHQPSVNSLTSSLEEEGARLGNELGLMGVGRHINNYILAKKNLIETHTV